MVGGPIVNGQEDYSQYPFNLATEAERQPGSAFKPFTLAMALESGKYGPDSIIDSAPQNFIVPNSDGKEHFIVHNFGNTYSGPITLQDATDVSDNTVFTQVGINVGTKRIANFATACGIRTPVSDNYAMIIGGLKIGVSPLDMAHAYETIAEGGRRVYDPCSGRRTRARPGSPRSTARRSARRGTGRSAAVQRVLPAPIAAVVHQMLTGVVQSGTGTSAAISGVDVAGKTGTTTNYADAWFVGWTPQMTTAVWVGYPNKLVPMTTHYNGAPVEGGTYPAIIWHNFMVQALQILASENPHEKITTATTTDTTSAPSIQPSGSGSGATTTSTARRPRPAAGRREHRRRAAPTAGGAAGNGGAGGGAGGTTGGGGGTGATGGGGGTGAGGTTGGGGGARPAAAVAAVRPAGPAGRAPAAPDSAAASGSGGVRIG